MSADNGVYILRTNNQYRVVRTQGIDDLFYNVISGGLPDGKMDPVAIVARFGSSQFTADRNMAYYIARQELSKGVCEYGIRELISDKSWKQIMKEAKENAKREIEYLREQNQSHKWDYQIAIRESIQD